MTWPNGVAIGPIQSAIYELGDCLSDLTDCLILLDTTNIEGIDYAREYARYIVASATFVALSDELHLLIDQSIANE